VSLAPASTETLFALGVGQRVIAGSASDDYPPAAIPLPDVATFEGVQVEKVVALKPDLVVAAGDLGQSEPAHKLRSLGIRSVVLGSKDLASIVSDIKLLGALTGTATAAQRITDRILSRIDQVKAAAATGPRPRVFYELGFTPPKGPLYGLTDGSFTAELVRIAGGDPITTGSASNAEMPVERLVKADPEVIILGDASYPGGPKPDEVPNRPGGWSGMAAVRSRAVRVIDDVIVTRPGPRLGDGVAALARAIRPGIVLPSAAP
jgi:iron complex transport system substrate-binding protein